MEALHFSETSVLTRAILRNIPEDGIFQFGKSLSMHSEGKFPENAGSNLPKYTASHCPSPA
jgi:hypothetical protein